MAIFVEGYTELVFVDRMVGEIANRNAVLIEWRQVRGGTTTRRTSRQIKAAGPRAGQEHFILLYDCGGDDAVKSRMVQEYASLAVAGYSSIVCVRDVYPKFSHAEIPRLEASLPLYVRTRPIVVEFVLSIMEVEAWFLAEHSHFARIDPAISLTAIRSSLRFDPERNDMQLRLAPAADLDDCYALAGKRYVKGNAQATVDAIDYAEVYAGLALRFPYLGKLCRAIDDFLKRN